MKTGSQTALKVLSIIGIIMGVLAIVFGVVIAAGFTSFVDPTMFVGIAAAVWGALMIIEGIIYIVIGAFGVRGANNPSKIGVFWVLCLIGVIIEALGVVMSLVSSRVTADGIISLLFVIIMFMLANNIKKQAQQNQA